MDKMDTQDAPIKMNEVLLHEDEHWLHFATPYRLIVAERLEDVIPALHVIERLMRTNDWYAAGFLSYEASSAFDPALVTYASTGFPYLWFGLYPKPHTLTLPVPKSPKERRHWEPVPDPESYQSAIDQIKQQIATGRTYQVNYTMRLRTDFGGNAWDFFLHLAQTQNNHAAYIDTGRYVICSASPELFFQLDGETITCRPMKGTAHRGRYHTLRIRNKRRR